MDIFNKFAGGYEKGLALAKMRQDQAAAHKQAAIQAKLPGLRAAVYGTQGDERTAAMRGLIGAGGSLDSVKLFEDLAGKRGDEMRANDLHGERRGALLSPEQLQAWARRDAGLELDANEGAQNDLGYAKLAENMRQYDNLSGKDQADVVHRRMALGQDNEHFNLSHALKQQQRGDQVDQHDDNYALKQALRGDQVEQFGRTHDLKTDEFVHTVEQDGRETEIKRNELGHRIGNDNAKLSQALKIANMKASAPTTKMREAQAAGLAPGTPEYTAFLKSGSNTNVTVNGEKPFTEAQARLSLFSTMMGSVAPVINAFEDKFTRSDYWQKAAGDSNLANALVKTPDFRMYESAGRQWVEGILRITTGAAATEDETARNFKTYFPQPGDDERTVAFKRQQRVAIEASVKGAGQGRFGEAPVADFDGFAAPSGPEEGTAEDGYVFIGGDPADPENWEKQ